MTELQKEFEATGYTSWVNADLYPDGKIYTQEYTQWLERHVFALRQQPVSGLLPLTDGKLSELKKMAENYCYLTHDDKPTISQKGLAIIILEATKP